MSKKRRMPAERPPHDEWMAPVEPSAPCGADLEYDPEFVVLFARAATRTDAQYGDFVSTAEPVNWSDIERDCRRLMKRSKDMRLAVLLARCRTRLAGGQGLSEGLALLAAWLTSYAAAIHPQPGVDDDRDAALEIRMNALQALTDTDGLLADVRDVALVRSSVARLQVRDVERALAQPRPGDALSAESVTQQLQDLRIRQPDTLADFDRALESLGIIEAWNQAQPGGFSADLSTLKRVLERVVGEGPVAAVMRAPPLLPDEQVEPAQSLQEPSGASGLDKAPWASPGNASNESAVHRLTGRDSALSAIREARCWFETYEPSSPIPVLLRRAEHFVGRRYSEVVTAIPVDVLVAWETEK
jgi:type VI secretion system protein ImpA